MKMKMKQCKICSIKNPANRFLKDGLGNKLCPMCYERIHGGKAVVVNRPRQQVISPTVDPHVPHHTIHCHGELKCKSQIWNSK